MLKNYDELRKVDVSRFCEDRDGFKYLNWARCIYLLRKHGAERAYFEPIPNPENGTSLYMTEQTFTDKGGNVNRIYETRIRVVVDQNEWIWQSPVLNGTNPVKDNSMNQLRVWNSMCRSFVKCVAVHTGLGFDLWLKEEMAALDNAPVAEDSDATSAQLKTIEKICKAHNLSLDKWLEKAGTTRDKLTAGEAGHMLNTLKSAYGDE